MNFFLNFQLPQQGGQAAGQIQILDGLQRSLGSSLLSLHLFLRLMMTPMICRSNHWITNKK